MNLACGVMGVVSCTVFQAIDLAFYFMLAGAVFDFCDGLSARALGAYSPMGKELDSLADMISFGLLPSVMLFMTMKISMGLGWTIFIPLLIAVFSGLRLAKFNVDERQSTSFIGLATPASAMICGSLAYGAYIHPDSDFAGIISGNAWIIPVTSIVLCALLVSEIPMFSMKIHKGEGMSKDMILRIAFAGCTAGAVVAVIALHWNWSMIILLAFVSYIIINILSALFSGAKK